MGRGGRGRVRQAPRLGRPVGPVAAPGGGDRHAARGAARPGPDPGRALRHGRLLVGPRGHLRCLGSSARRPGLLRPRLRPCGHRQRPRAHGGRGVVQVGWHRRDRQPAAGLREGLRGRRHRPPRADRGGDRSRLAARHLRDRGRLPRLPRRPVGRRQVLCAHGVRPGAERARGRRHRRPPRRGRGDPPGARGRLGRQPGSPPGQPDRCRQPGRCRQARPVQRRGAVRRLRRLGRTAHRRVHGQGRQGRAAGHRRVADLAQLLPELRRRDARLLRPRLALRRRPHQVRLGRQRRRPARGADADVGARDRGRRGDHRDQPLRPARRRECQAGRARHARRWRRPVDPGLHDGPVTVYASPGWLSPGVSNVHDAITELLAGLDPQHGYVAVQAYLDRHRDGDLADVRSTIAAATERPVTFGWGPRFLHSTGQYHKGGPAPASTSRSPASPSATSPCRTGRSPSTSS